MSDGKEKHVILRDEKGHFLKGQSAHPQGRPKVGETLAEIVRNRLTKVEVILEDGTVTTKLDLILDSMEREAIAGSEKAAEILLERGYGKAKTILEISQKDEYVLDWGDGGDVMLLEDSGDILQLEAGENNEEDKD